MKAEIIAVGTELLLGQTVNTNATYLSQGLAELGVDVYFQTVVGDNESRIRSAIELARTRADLIVFTGGLGPTQDDLTKDTLANYLGRELVTDEPSMHKIEQLFATRGMHMVESNRRQANSIVGATPLFNDAGLAVGNGLTVDGTHYLLLPGPPREMKTMFEGPGKEWIRHIQGEVNRLYSKLLKFAGIGESTLEAALLDLIKQQSDPTIAPYAKEGEVAIRISTKAATEQEAHQRLLATEEQIRARVGQYLFATEDIPLEAAIIRLLREQRKTLSSAESLTGGLFGQLLTTIPGSSGEYVGGVVTYTNAMKHAMLGIPMEQLEGDSAPGAISGSTAQLMAERIRERTDSDFAVSLTGVAGPTESEGKPVGLVYFAIARKNLPTLVHTAKLVGNRSMVRTRAVKTVLYHLWQLLVS